MNGYLKLLLDTLEDPSPGLLFDAHKKAGVPKRAYRSGHVANPALGPEGLAELRALCGDAPNGLDALVDLYSLHDGMRLYRYAANPRTGDGFAVELFPFELWEEKTAYWRSEEMAWLMEDAGLHQLETWRVIGAIGNGAQHITMFFGGVYNGFEQVGRCYVIGMDGLLGFDEELAANFEQLAIQISGKRVVDTFDRVGFTGFLQTGERDGLPIGFGDIVRKYLPNVERNRHLVE